MKQSVQELKTAVTAMCRSNISKKDFARSVAYAVNEQYEIPLDICTDILTLRKPLDAEDVSPYILFALLSKMDHAKLAQFFQDDEIETLSSQKYRVEPVKFPLVWNMIQITSQQWIGKIDVKDLMKLRDAQLIVYNENAQRTLKRMIHGDTEYYAINLNKRAVHAIMQLMKDGVYVPNTLTLNLSDDSCCIYDEERGKLIIHEGAKFDILDGYHRYVAMSNLYNQDATWNQEMELRVVVFPEERARQFIWQEDQKTKMAKVDSNSFNTQTSTTDVLNIVSPKLPHGLLNKGGSSIIDYACMFACVDTLYINAGAVRQNSHKTQVANEIVDYLNQLNDECPEVFDKSLSFKAIACMMYLCSIHVGGIEILKKLIKAVPSNILTGRRVNRTSINKIAKIYQEVMSV